MNKNDWFEKLTDALATIFKIGPSNLVGIDIGLSSVRVAEFSFDKKNRPKLQKFSFRDLSEGCLIEDEIIRPEEISNAIIDCFSESKIKNTNVCIGVSGPNTMSKRITVVAGTKDEIEDQVHWESEQYIPFGIDDSTVSYHIIGENEGGGTDVMVAAIRNDIVESFEEVIKKTKLRCRVVDLNLFALANIFETIAPTAELNSPDSILIIDFGAQTTNMIIYKNRTVIFTRELSMGGYLITEEIQRQLGLTFTEAEDLKIHGDESGNLPEEVVEIIEMSLDSFFSEIKKTINFFMTASSEESVDKCYVTGGSSLVPGLIEGLETSLSVTVKLMNPFEKIAINDRNITEDMMSIISSMGLIALGLALRKRPK